MSTKIDQNDMCGLGSERSLLTVKQVAELLNCSARYVRTLASRNVLRGVRLTSANGGRGRWKFAPADVQAYLKRSGLRPDSLPRLDRPTQEQIDAEREAYLRRRSLR